MATRSAPRRKPKSAAKPAAVEKSAGKSAKSVDLDAISVSAEALGKLLGVSRKWIEKLAGEGVIEREAKGKYPVGAAVRGYIGWLKDDQRRSSKTAADSRLRDARARLIELRIAEQSHELIETEEAIATVDEIIGTIRAEASGVAATVTRDVEIRDRIEAAIDGIFSRAAARFEQKAVALRASGGDDQAVTEDDS